MRVYNSQMIRLSEEHPIIYKYFTGGGFSVQISKDTFLVEYLLTKLLKKTQTRIPQTAGGTKVSAQNHLQWVNTTSMLNMEVQP